MKKKIIAMITVVTLLLVSTFVYAASTAKVYYNNASLSVGTTSSIRNRLTSMGYTTSRASIPTKATLLSDLGSNAVIHVLSHGGNDIVTCSNGSLSGTEVRAEYFDDLGLSNTEFVFLECCYAGNSLAGRISSCGAQSVIGFKNEVTAGSDSNGIHYFADRVYSYLYNSYSVSTSVSSARMELYQLQGSYYGADSVVIYGGSNTIN